MKPRFSASRGFSLIEVTLALGIAAFSLIAMLGLFSVALDSSRNSAADTTLPRIVSTVLSENSGITAPVADEVRTFYFTMEGERVDKTEAYAYTCEVTFKDPTAAGITDAADHLLLLSIRVIAPGRTRTVQATMLR